MPRNADYMTTGEATAVTSMGTAFRSTTATHFNELRQFVGLTYIGGHAFNNAQIKKIYIPHNVEYIGRNSSDTQFTFQSRYIESIDFPMAFKGFNTTHNLYNVYGLKSLVFRNPSLPSKGANTIQVYLQSASSAKRNGKIYVPAGSVDAYRSASFLSPLINLGWEVVPIA